LNDELDIDDEIEEPPAPPAEDAAGLAWCEYDACEEFAKRDGLCLKHLVAWRKGDAEAVAAHGRYLAKQPGACVPAPRSTGKQRSAQWRARQAEQTDKQPPVGEETMTMARKSEKSETFECKQCGRSFAGPHGLKIHAGRMHGQKKSPRPAPPAAAAEPSAPETAGPQPRRSNGDWAGADVLRDIFRGLNLPATVCRVAGGVLVSSTVDERLLLVTEGVVTPVRLANAT